jgi:prefoldin subunit 5
MDGASSEKALERIEAALARIENAANRPAEAANELRDRHERLRTAVTQSLRQLDDLLAGQP